MSVPDVDIFKKLYPDWINSPTPLDIILFIFFFSLPLLIPYLYIRFFEGRVASLVRNRLVPFIRYRLHLEKLIVLIDRILKIQIFRNPKAKI